MSLVGFKAQNHPQQDVKPDVDDRRTPPDLLAECARLAGVEEFDLDVAATDRPPFGLCLVVWGAA